MIINNLHMAAIAARNVMRDKHRTAGIMMATSVRIGGSAYIVSTATEVAREAWAAELEGAQLDREAKMLQVAS